MSDPAPREPGNQGDPNAHGRARVVLRGATLVSAPFTLLGIIGVSLAVFGILWTVDRGGDTASGWLFVAATAAAGAAGFVATRGCKVVVDTGCVRDVVAWRTVRVTPSGSIAAIRVRRGPWRTYEIETDDGHRSVVLGAGPVQFPSYLLPGAAERDLAAIDAMGGDLRS